MGEKKISIKQIAKLAGVSVATISRVMNQKGGYTPDTEKKVLSVIKENQYIPNLVAKGLRTNNTRIIGLIVPDIVNEFFAKLVLYIQMELFQYGYLTMVCNVNESGNLERQLVKALVAQNISGLILISGRTRKMTVNSLPTIYIDRRPNEEELQDNLVIIESDNVSGGYLATKELINCGCKKIAFITDAIGESSKIARYEGYCRAIMESRLPLNPTLTLKVENVSIEDAFNVVVNGLDAKLEFDGIFCSTDMLGIGAILALKSRGFDVPKDIKITGFDDISMSSLFQPSITTIHQHSDKMAKLASDLIIDLINGIVIEEKHRMVPISLVQRNSTGE